MNDQAPVPVKAPIQAGGQLAALAPQSLDETYRLAQALARAGDMVPKHFQGHPDMIMAAVMRGAEIGLMPMQALSNIAVINGRASLWGDALPALMQRAGHQLDCEVTGEGDSLVATATLIRGDTGQKIVRSFSAADAKAAGLWNKAGPWQQYKPRMLSMRARSLACRDGAADAMMGLQVAEEAQDMPPMRDVTPREEAPSGFAAIAMKAREAAKPAEADPVPHWTSTVDTTEAFPGNDAFGEGAQAFADGKTLIDCPHVQGSAESVDWIGGWQMAARAKE